ncbi:MAG TPA: hypothetical protein VM686_42475 [Polyangiaceae bacterium]|nr:hypothetical protein [Polyangiaceae bacterium]
MSVVSIHPEDLLDKIACGELTSAERELLETHLSSCDVCRFELAVSVDFQNELCALTAAKAPAGLPLGALQLGPERPQVERRRSRRVIWAIAAAMLIASTGAVASVTRVGQSLVGLLRGGDELAATSHAPARPPAPRSTAIEAAAPVPAPSAVATPALEAGPQASATPSPRRAPTPARPSVGQSDEQDSADSAESLFAAANQARRRGDLTQATALYRDLQKTFPRSQEAELSQVTLSMLLLDRGDAAAALTGFDRYLARSRRPLEAEALVGRARALGALGSRSAEEGAWREVQRKYPGSVYARQATDRLSALGQP